MLVARTKRPEEAIALCGADTKPKRNVGSRKGRVYQKLTCQIT